MGLITPTFPRGRMARPPALLDALGPLLDAPGAVMPADGAIVAALLGAPWTAPAVEVALDDLVSNGELRRVYIGTEPHVALRSASGDPSAPLAQREPSPPDEAHAAGTLAAPTVSAAEETFRLRVEIDAEHERLVLYRTALVGAAVVGLVVLREWALRSFGG